MWPKAGPAIGRGPRQESWAAMGEEVGPGGVAVGVVTAVAMASAVRAVGVGAGGAEVGQGWAREASGGRRVMIGRGEGRSCRPGPVEEANRSPPTVEARAVALGPPSPMKSPGDRSQAAKVGPMGPTWLAFVVNPMDSTWLALAQLHTVLEVALWMGLSSG